MSFRFGGRITLWFRGLKSEDEVLCGTYLGRRTVLTDKKENVKPAGCAHVSGLRLLHLGASWSLESDKLFCFYLGGTSFPRPRKSHENSTVNLRVLVLLGFGHYGFVVIIPHSILRHLLVCLFNSFHYAKRQARDNLEVNDTPLANL
jgi:hypothetical protein